MDGARMIRQASTTRNVVITGVGMVTPLGRSAGEVLARMARGERVAASPGFDVSAFDCKVCAPVEDFDAAEYFRDNKTLRLMNRDARLAAVAAKLAMQDAQVQADRTWPGDQIALFGATGITGLPAHDIAKLVRHAAGPDGSLDLSRFGRVALKRVRPVLSFKILANMPICFVSILQGIRGPNAIYTPWEGHCAQAIAAGAAAVRQGLVPCALVGGCDVKTHAFSFISLQQMGVFDAWSRGGSGCVPGEGAAFLVLEDEQAALARGAKIKARLAGWAIRTAAARLGSPKSEQGEADVYLSAISGAGAARVACVVAAADGDPVLRDAERAAIVQAGVKGGATVQAKRHMGNLFAAAAATQVGLGAEIATGAEAGQRILVDCFGHGSQQAAIVLEAV